MIRSRHHLVRGAVVATLLSLVLVATWACDVRHVELGSDLAAAPTTTVSRTDAAVATGYGCPTWIDEELNGRRIGTCEGTCAAVPDHAYDLSDNVEVLAGTAGRWSFCGSRLGPPDAIGIEFVPGCRLFFLRYDDAGIAVRGTEASYQADFDIFDRASTTDGRARIDLHFTATTTRSFDVVAFRCPERVILRGENDTIELGRFDGHGGTGIPVK